VSEAPAKKKGGARPGAGRKKNQAENHGSEKPRRSDAKEILDSVGQGKIKGHADGCKCWKCLWVRDCELPGAAGFQSRKYLWDRYAGKPVDTINHLHDKPLEATVTLTLGEGMRLAMMKADERVRNRK
jgi:hypothetical protein